MRKITIYRHYFTNSDCYKSGIIQVPKGVQVHSTGATNSYLKRYVGPDDGRLGKNEYNNTHNRPGGDVCANAYIGRLNDGTPAIYQTLPWDMRCWLSGNGSSGNANKLGFIGFEICEDNRQHRDYFEQVVMGLSVDLTAYLCQEYNIPVENVLDHSELHRRGIGSDHGDITWWLKNFGYNMDMYRAAVKAAMDEGVEVTYINASEQEVAKPMYNAKVVAKSGSSVNLRASASTSAKILVKVPIGETVGVIADVNNLWKQVQYKNQSGYMMSEYLQEIKETTNTPVTNTSNKEELTLIKKKLTEAIELIDKLLAK